MDWFLYDNGLRHERVKYENSSYGTYDKIFFSFVRETTFIETK